LRDAFSFWGPLGAGILRPLGFAIAGLPSGCLCMGADECVPPYTTIAMQKLDSWE